MDWLATVAMAHGLRLSVVGGAVRDRLLGKNTPDKDLDLVVEGEGSWPAIQLLELIKKQELPEGFQRVEKNPAFVDLIVERKDLTEKIGSLLSILLKKNSAISTEENETTKDTRSLSKIA